MDVGREHVLLTRLITLLWIVQARCRQAEKEAAADQVSFKAAVEGELQAAKDELARLAEELRGARNAAEQREAALEEASTRIGMWKEAVLHVVEALEYSQRIVTDMVCLSCYRRA